jgi:hypothetical protein
MLHKVQIIPQFSVLTSQMPFDSDFNEKLSIGQPGKPIIFSQEKFFSSFTSRMPFDSDFNEKLSIGQPGKPIIFSQEKFFSSFIDWVLVSTSH